jgi:electron transfer flavoprotein beta subunit
LKILVPVKRVVDYNVKVRVKSDGSGVDIANVKMSMNPFDEIAVEEAVRLKEAGVATEVIAVSCGVTQCQETLRAAMAIGADRGILVESTAELAAARGREAAQGPVRKGAAADRDLRQAGDRRRRQPDRPDAGRADGLATGHVRFQGGRVGDKANVTREIDGGLETLEIRLPAVVSTDLRLNEPRYATLPNIMKAKKKPLETFKPEDLGIDVTPRISTLKVTEPPKRSAGERVADVAQLVDKLKNEAKVI